MTLQRKEVAFNREQGPILKALDSIGGSRKSWEPSWSVRAPVYHTPSANLSWECFVNCHGNPLGHGDPISRLQIEFSGLHVDKLKRASAHESILWHPVQKQLKRLGNMATHRLLHWRRDPLAVFDCCISMCRNVILHSTVSDFIQWHRPKCEVLNMGECTEKYEKGQFFQRFTLRAISHLPVVWWRHSPYPHPSPKTVTSQKSIIVDWSQEGWIENISRSYISKCLVFLECLFNVHNMLMKFDYRSPF